MFVALLRDLKRCFYNFFANVDSKDHACNNNDEMRLALSNKQTSALSCWYRYRQFNLTFIPRIITYFMQYFIKYFIRIHYRLVRLKCILQVILARFYIFQQLMLHNTLVLNYLPFSVLQQQWVVTHLKWFDGSDSAEYRDEVARW